MRFALKRQPNRIYFWERIAFRISVGFVFPILLSAYALFYVSGVYTEMAEFEDRMQRMWNVIHVNESKVLLSLTKIRMNSQIVLTGGDPQAAKQLDFDLKELRSDLVYSMQMLNEIEAANDRKAEQNPVRLFAQLSALREELGNQVTRIASSQGRLSGPEAQGIHREVERLATDMEKSMGKLRAAIELEELEVGAIVRDGRSRSTRVLGFFLASVLFFGICAAVLVTLSLTGPVKGILRRVKDIATGDGDLSQRVFVRSGGELKELADWMNVFLEKTEKIIATISNASSVVRQTTSQVGLQTGRMNLSSSEISKNMMEQSMNLDECTSSLSSIDDLLQNSGESTRQAASLSKIAMDRALQGGASVHETIEAMEKIEESARKIEALVSSINDIASQTNLLAINAAIEATKAGDHGKGFAVVAEEVRKLAERARKLTGEVTSLMAESGMRVKAGVNLAKGAGVSLDGIIQDVEAVSSLIQRVAAASSKQAESSSVVLEFMQKVSSAVRTNLTEMHEVTKASEYTTLEVNKLDSLVNQLNQIVSQFQSADLEEVTGTLSGIAPLPEIAELEPPMVAKEDEVTDSMEVIPEMPAEEAPQAQAAPPPMPSRLPPPLPKLPDEDEGGGHEDAA